MNLSETLSVCRRAYAFECLAHLRRKRGARQAELRASTCASQPAIRDAVAHLIVLGFVEAKEGYGHPLRPEIVLTADGRRVARFCDEALLALGERSSVVRRRWAMAVLQAIGPRQRRYAEIRRSLPGVTDRALASALKELDGAGLILRVVSSDRPPQVSYRVLLDGPWMLDSGAG